MEIEQINIFKNLDSESIEKIKPYIKRVAFKKRQTIFAEGQGSEWFYIVAKGKIKITKMSQDGKEVILELIQSGELFGAVAVLNSFNYPANAVAMDDSEVLKIKREDIFYLIEQFPQIMYSLTSTLGERIVQSHQMLKNIALDKVEDRIASILLKYAVEEKSTGPDTEPLLIVKMKLTKQDIADMVGATVETTIRTLSKFKKAGYIGYKEGKIVINNKDVLGGYVSS